MVTGPVDLSDLLTAGGRAMSAANARLRGGDATALLRTFELGIHQPGTVRLAAGAAGLILLRGPKLICHLDPHVHLKATYIAAPALVPVDCHPPGAVSPGGEGGGP